MIELTLLRQHHPLANSAEQLRILESSGNWPRFDELVADQTGQPLIAAGLAVLQINVGKICNQTCSHCHVDAGPDRREVMSREIAELCLDVLRRGNFETLDITGGAPEMCPEFRTIVTGARNMGRRVIDRCNLTILEAPGYEDLPAFLAENQVEIVASLPCYLEANVDRQRGDRVFERSLRALHKLNKLGYGQSDSPLRLTLVYNPVGPMLPPPQEALEADYRRELRSRYGIEFNQLYTITNMPISRFLDDLLESGQYESYMESLVMAFNPSTVEGVMCRTMLSVDWCGNLFDCDFNQMLNLGLSEGQPQHLRDLDDATLTRLTNRRIVTGQHCFGCTAGNGSSCGGRVIDSQAVE